MRECATGTAERRGLTRTTHRDRRTGHVRKGCPGTWDGVSALCREIGTSRQGTTEPVGRREVGVSYPDEGTPQGGVISPLLANIYLHTVLDDWFVRDVQPALTRTAEMIRFADDLVVVFESKQDAERFLAVLPKRLGRYGQPPARVAGS